jgi:ribA/ribD-fused uncharacterized protein
MIDDFKGKYFFLSNFYDEGLFTNEHRFQSLKTDNAEERKRVLMADSPREAKKLGRRVSLRDDWEEVKDSIMFLCLRIKFSDLELRQKLIDTGDEELIEGNWWGDRYWGACPGYLSGNQRWIGKTHTWYGENKLGQLLMKLRGEYRGVNT